MLSVADMRLMLADRHITVIVPTTNNTAWLKIQLVDVEGLGQQESGCATLVLHTLGTKQHRAAQSCVAMENRVWTSNPSVGAVDHGVWTSNT